MILKIQLNQEEYEQWAHEAGKRRLLERCREISNGPDIDRVTVHIDSLHQIEIAPAEHSRLAARIRELGLHDLAKLVDPAHMKDEEARSRYADQLTRFGIQYSVAAPRSDG